MNAPSYCAFCRALARLSLARWTLCLLGTLAAIPTARAADNDARVYEITPAQRLNLRQLDQFILTDQAEAAVDLAVRVIDQADGRLVAVTGPKDTLAQSFLPLPLVVQDRLLAAAAEHPQVLRAFRSRYDQTAETQLQRVREADRPEWTPWLHRYLASSHGDEALLAIADRALQQGQPHRAIAVLRRIGSFAAAAGGAQSLPVGTFRGSQIPGGAVGARMVYALLLAGDAQQAERWSAWVTERFGDQTVELAGRRGTVADRLQWLEQQTQSWRRAEPPQRRPRANPSWPRWVRATPAGELPPAQIRPPASPPGELALPSPILPLVAGGKVFLNTGRELYAVALDDGEPWPAGIGSHPVFVAYAPDRDFWPAVRAVETIPRWSAAAEGRWLAARFGSPMVPGDAAGPQATPSQLVVLDLEQEARLQTGYPLVADPDSRFASVPLLSEGRMMVAIERIDEAAVSTHLRCVDISTGQTLWDSPPLAIAPVRRQIARTRDVAVALDGQRLVCHVDGVTAAVDLSDGRLTWLVRHATTELDDSPYPRPRPSAEKFATGLTVHQGQVVVAGIDVDRVVGLDAADGRLSWASEAGVGDDVFQVLGVVDGHWLLAGRRLYWFEQQHGTLAATFPAAGTSQLGGGQSLPVGRGQAALAGGLVYWPSSDGILAIDGALTKPSPAVDLPGAQNVREPTAPAVPSILGRVALEPLGLEAGNLASTPEGLINVGSRYLAAIETSSGRGL